MEVDVSPLTGGGQRESFPRPLSEAILAKKVRLHLIMYYYKYPLFQITSNIYQNQNQYVAYTVCHKEVFIYI